MYNRSKKQQNFGRSVSIVEFAYRSEEFPPLILDFSKTYCFLPLSTETQTIFPHSRSLTSLQYRFTCRPDHIAAI